MRTYKVKAIKIPYEHGHHRVKVWIEDEAENQIPFWVLRHKSVALHTKNRVLRHHYLTENELREIFKDKDSKEIRELPLKTIVETVIKEILKAKDEIETEYKLSTNYYEDIVIMDDTFPDKVIL